MDIGSTTNYGIADHFVGSNPVFCIKLVVDLVSEELKALAGVGGSRIDLSSLTAGNSLVFQWSL